MVLVVVNPADVSQFMRFFKAESAHMLNRALGRRKKTVWCEGYDSPIVLTETRTLNSITYIYANPAQDNLEVSIDKYPGLSSWKMFRTGKLQKTWKRIRRPAVKKLCRSSHSLKGYTKEAAIILVDSKEENTFTLSPNAWMEAFNITDPEQQEAINNKLIHRVRTFEKEASDIRKKEKKRKRLLVHTN
jgi:hypothetical protein